MQEYKIRAVTECHHVIHVCYFIDEDNTIHREKVLLWVIDGDGTDDYVTAMTMDREGCISDPTDSLNFLGFEFNNKESDWTKEINSYKKRKATRKLKCPKRHNA